LSGTAHKFIEVGKARKKKNQVILISGLATIIMLLALAVIVFSRQSNTNAQLAKQNANIANTAQAASTYAIGQQATAQSNAEESLARQLAAQAQSLFVNGNSKQEIAVLLAIQSMNPSR
jgi:cytochrome c-type biogenesis protein CcmH/NrfF